MNWMIIATLLISAFAGVTRAATGRSEAVAQDAKDKLTASSDSSMASYLLGPNDQVTIFVPDSEELSARPQRIDLEGYIDLPMVGRIHAAEMTTRELAAEIQKGLKRYFTNPEVTLTISEFRSQPVSVLGEVNSPGVHQLQGHKTLFEVLSLAGGLRETAGNEVKITRDLKWGSIPLPNAKNDATGHFSIASVSTKTILEASDPTQNIEIKPDDVISVEKTGIVYVIGSVHKPGGFVLGENSSLSALQVLSLAEGLEAGAAPHRAKILRGYGSPHAPVEIPVDLKKLLTGQTADVRLNANDVLFIPSSFAKSTALRSLETVIGMSGQIGAGLAIYH